MTTSTGRPWLLGLRALLGLSSATVLVWAVARGDFFGAAAAVGCVAYALALAWRHRRPACWRLTWDGQGWSLQAAESGPLLRGDLAVALDLGDALLLRFVPEATRCGASRWLPLHRSDSPAEWHALRCALYSPRAAEP